MPAKGGARAHENTPIGAGHARDTEPPTLAGPWPPDHRDSADENHFTASAKNRAWCAGSLIRWSPPG